VFRDPDDTKWIVFAVNGATYYTRPHNTAREIALPDGVTLDAAQRVEFVQANGALYMFRGTEEAPLRLNSVSQEAWQEIAQLDNDPEFLDQNPEDGTETIPAADWAVCLQNRLVLPNMALGRDVLSISDYFNVTRYQPTLESFRISQPDDEKVLSAFPVPTPDDTPSSALLVGKETQNFIVSGISGNLAGLARQDVTGDYGFSLRRAIWRVGRDIWGVVPKRGVFSLSQTSQNKWQGIDVPISQEIQPVFNRINWTYADQIRAVKVGNFSYIAVPLDDAIVQSGPPVFDPSDLANLAEGQSYDEGSWTVPTTPLTYYLWVPGNSQQLEYRQGLSLVGTVATASIPASGYLFQVPAGQFMVLRKASGSGPVTDKFYDLTPDKSDYPNIVEYASDVGDAQAAPYGRRRVVITHSQSGGVVFTGATLPLTRPTDLNTQAEVMGRTWVYAQFGFEPGDGTPKWYQVDGGDWPLVSAAEVAENDVPDEVVELLGTEPPPFLVPYSVPVANANNAILVYDHVNKAWAGYDTGVSVFDMFPFPVLGVERLLILTNQGFLGIYEEADLDHGPELLDDTIVGTARNEIEHTWATRGYALRSKLGRIRATDLAVQLQTFNPRYTLSARLDGVNETRTIADARTRDRRKYFRPHTKPRYVETNENDDHALPYREDYSVDYSGGVDRGSGINGGLKQEATEHYAPPKGSRGQFVVIEGSNDQGACDLHAVAIESKKVDRRKGTVV
jgi:hypothetical protein